MGIMIGYGLSLGCACMSFWHLYMNSGLFAVGDSCYIGLNEQVASYLIHVCYWPINLECW